MDKDMKRILILGCDGYIGEHLVAKMSNADVSIAGFDLQNTKGSNRLLDNIFCGDVSDLDALEKCVCEVNPDVIIDLAANADVSPDSSIADYEVNFCTPENICAILAKHSQLALRRVIFTSSQYVIGPSHSGEEKFGYAPHTVYGISKVILEQCVFDLEAKFTSFGVDYFIVRPTNVWGGRHPKYSTTWEKLLKRFLVVVPFKKVIKSYCHISTLCQLFENMVKVETHHLAKYDRVIYGTDLPMTQIDWIKLQVGGLREHGVSAGFFRAPIWVLYSLSFMITAVSIVFRVNNPLPQSRVDSMTYSYLVNMDAPESLSHNQSYDDLAIAVYQDLAGRLIE
jgi:GlcNAc-P-P-Und epimerase